MECVINKVVEPYFDNILRKFNELEKKLDKKFTELDIKIDVLTQAIKVENIGKTNKN